MFKKALGTLTTVMVIGVSIVSAAPQITLSGYLDADVWSDLSGNFFSNTEIDLGVELQFTDNVSANLYVTVNSNEYTLSGGRIPGGAGAPDERWVSVHFDGLDITYKSPIGTFSVGDLVYEFGGFDYYLYKRLSMIAPESFTRGVRYVIEPGPLTQEIIIGVADQDYNTVDLVGVSSFSAAEDQTVSVAYGIRGNARMDFATGFDFFAGGEYEAGFGPLDLKMNIGFTSFAGAERANVMTLLAEPVVEFGKFSTAFSFYRLFDFDSFNDLSDPLFGIEDEMFFYLEPGYSFSDVIAAGLPLEYHSFSLDTRDDDEFWIVPTLYVYPSASVEWWIWGLVALPTAGGDAGFGIGSEIIISF